MVPDKLSQLGARLLGDKVADVDSALEALNRSLLVSTSFREVLLATGGALVFEKGAKFKTDDPSPLNDKHGYQNLEVIFGLGDGKHSIKHQAARYEGQLPPSFLPIGEAPGGNLVCFDEAGKVFLWDHESLEGEGVWLIANSFDEFFKRLEPDESELGSTEGIVESESFLDF